MDSPLSIPESAASSPLDSPFFPLVQRTVSASSTLPTTPYPRRPLLRRSRASSDLAVSMPPTPTTSTTALLGAHTIDVATPPPPYQSPAQPPLRSDIKPMPWPRPDHPRLPWRQWTAVLFAINVAGVYGAGLGAIWLERGIYATRPLMDPSVMRPGKLGHDRARPELLGIWQSPQLAMGAGAAASAIGLSASLWATWRCCLDGRALASRGLANNPRALYKPNIYGSINAFNQFLWWAYRFRAEATRDHADIHSAWLNGAMGAVAAAAFAAFQSIALSSSETLRGELLPGWRLAISRAALTTVGISYPLYAHFIAEPGSSAEVRMTLRVAASAALTIANMVVLTHMRKLTPQQVRNADVGVFDRDARLAASRRRLGFVPQHFYPLALLTTHGIGRLLIHIFSVPFAMLYRQGQSPTSTNGTLPNGTLPSSNGPMRPSNVTMPLPPPGPNQGPQAAVGAALGAALSTDPTVFAARPPPDAGERVGIALVAVGVAVGFAVAGLFGYDASKVRRRDWGVLCAACLLSTTLVGVHRVINETQRNDYEESNERISLALGTLGYAMEFVSLVSLFAYSQMRNGRPSWPWTDHVLQLVRATGDSTLHMWALMAGVKSVSPFAIAATFTAGSFLTQLGLAIPTGVVGHAQTKAALEHEEALELEHQRHSPELQVVQE